MNKKQKKIIAREFLILICCLLIAILAFACTYPYNYFVNSSISKLDSEIKVLENQIDSIQEPFRKKIAEQKRVYSEWMNNDRLDKNAYSDYRAHWARLEYLHRKDSIPFKYKNVWSKVVIDHLQNMGFSTSNELDEFIATNSISEIDKTAQTKSKPLEDKILKLREKYRQKKGDVLYYDDQLNFSLIVLLFASIIAFPLRFLIYAIKWSFKTLKDENEEKSTTGNNV